MSESIRVLLNPKNEAYISRKSRKVARPSLWSSIGMTLLGVLFLVPTLMLVGVSADRLTQTIALSLSGRETQATIIDRDRNPPPARGETYTITYQFQTDGRTYTNSAWARSHIFNQLEEADELTITYLPSDPDISMLSGQNAQIGQNYIEPVAFPLVASLVTLLMIVVGVTEIRDVWRSSSRLSRLEQNGRLLHTGKIVHIALKPVWESNGQNWEARITYCFTNPRGVAFTRRLSLTRKEQADFPAVGAKLVLLYVTSRDHEVL